MALLPPTPRPSARAAAMVNAGARERVRRAYFRSWRTLSIAAWRASSVPEMPEGKHGCARPLVGWAVPEMGRVGRRRSDVRLSPTRRRVLNAPFFLKESRNARGGCCWNLECFRVFERLRHDDQLSLRAPRRDGAGSTERVRRQA